MRRVIATALLLAGVWGAYPAHASVTTMRCSFTEGPDRGMPALLFHFAEAERLPDGTQVNVMNGNVQLRTADISPAAITILVDALGQPPWRNEYRITRSSGAGRMTWKRPEGTSGPSFAIQCTAVRPVALPG
jgi:hypothetical protein